MDFIIHSVEFALQKHFGKSLSDKGVHILDPFTGTGSFITRLIQSGLLDANLAHKYKSELWANEITLLAYYIAQLNITSVFHEQFLRLENLQNSAQNSQNAPSPSLRGDLSPKQSTNSRTSVNFSKFWSKEMNGFNDLKEKLEAQGIAVSKNDGLNSSANLNSATTKNGSSNSNSAINSNSSALNAKNKAKNAEFESIAEKEKRLRDEFMDFAKGEDILK